MKLLQMDFIFHGPSKDEMNQSFQDLAKSIAVYPGLIWKIWTVNEEFHEAGGIYLFDNEDSLDNYVQMHTERLKSFGVTSVNSKVFDIPEGLTKITRGQLTREREAVIVSNKPTSEIRLLQMDFSHNGPGKEEMDITYQDLAKSIAEYSGVIWKIWTVNEVSREAGGIYLFEDDGSLNNYLQMHRERLKGFGITTVNAKVFKVPEVLSAITCGPIPQ